MGISWDRRHALDPLVLERYCPAIVDECNEGFTSPPRLRVAVCKFEQITRNNSMPPSLPLPRTLSAETHALAPLYQVKVPKIEK